MANINAYKALGKSLGKYRKNLTDIDKASIESNLLSFQYSQDRAMTDTLTRTIAEIGGIVAEKTALNRDLNLGKKSAGVYSSKEEYQPLGKFGKFIGLDVKQRKVFKSRKSDLTLDPKTLSQIGIMERLGLKNEYSDFNLDEYYDKQGPSESEVYQSSMDKSPIDFKIDKVINNTSSPVIKEPVVSEKKSSEISGSSFNTNLLDESFSKPGKKVDAPIGVPLAPLVPLSFTPDETNDSTFDQNFFKQSYGKNSDDNVFDILNILGGR